MTDIPYIEPGTYVFRFLDPRGPHFWPAIADMLSERRLFLNSRTNFNDPFDSQPIIDNDLSNSAIREYCQDALRNPFNLNRSPLSIARINEFKESNRTHLTKRNVEGIKTYLRRSIEKYLDTAGLLCFSLVAEDPSLWGHFAASFTGICAVFRRSTSTASALSMCARVAYVRRRPQLPLSLFHEMTRRWMSNEPHDDLANEIFFRSFLHKSAHWQSEQEARIFLPFEALKKASFEYSELVGFILGAKCSPDLENKLRREIAARRGATEVCKSVLSCTDFRIMIPHKFTNQHARAA
jgi:hypothetical protein